MKDSGLVFLKDFAELQVLGEDSREFLQGQISADMEKISEINSSLGCLCNVKGRVISSFYIIKNNSDDSFSLIGPKQTIKRTFEELSKYIPFYKSKMEVVDKSNLFGCKKETSEVLFGSIDFVKQNTINYQDLKLLHFLNKHFILIYASEDLSKTLKAISTNDPSEWTLDEINNRNVEIEENTSQLYLPHELHYHESGRIDFKKGCYTGQEIIARMQYRSKTLPVLYILESEKEVKRNMVITKRNSDKKIGNVVSSVKSGTGFIFLASISKNLEEKEVRIRELNLDLSIN